MRLWTALTGWAALIATAIALHALALTQDTVKAGSGDGWARWAVALALIATSIFAGDLVVLGGREVARRRAGRHPVAEFGVLDYMPEFTRAIQDYATAQGEINSATVSADALITNKTDELQAEHDPQRRQALGVEVGNACSALSELMHEKVSLMTEKATVIKQCLMGLVRTSSLQTVGQVQEMVDSRAGTVKARQANVGLGAALAGAQTTFKDVRTMNLSLAINSASRRLMNDFGEYRKTVRTLSRDFRRAERIMGHRLLWASIRRRIVQQ